MQKGNEVKLLVRDKILKDTVENHLSIQWKLLQLVTRADTASTNQKAQIKIYNIKALGNRKPNIKESVKFKKEHKA